MNKGQNILLPCLLVAIALGTAWAIRGKFGHEQGAAWAGAIGGAALVLVSKRSDWQQKVMPIMLASAFGWGMGGMVSYGMVVGYGRASDFTNVFYGLCMLFVIGALYGFTGGGMLALALIDSEKLKIKWHQLIVEMTVIGMLTYALLINQLEWLMTPPRSELWAACLGASIALAWFTVRINQRNVLHVAIWSALGAGFGFAFGNVLQVIGGVINIPMNMWNVMEYSIGFFGGFGMSYGALTCGWENSNGAPSGSSRVLIPIIIGLIIPFMVWDQSLTLERLSEFFGSSAGIVRLLALLLIVLMFVFIAMNKRKQHVLTGKEIYRKVLNTFLILVTVFTMLSFLLTGAWVHPVEQYLYIVNIIIFLLLIDKTDPVITPVDRGIHQMITATIILFLLIISTFVMINAHGELKGSQQRFGVATTNNNH